VKLSEPPVIPLPPDLGEGDPDQEKVPAPVLKSRSARLVATIATGWIRTGVTLVIGLVATPLLIRLIGPDRFGVVRTAEQYFAYLDFLGFGLSAAFSVLLVRAAISGTETDVNQVAKTGMRLIARQFLWVIPAGLAMIVVFPFAFHLSGELRAEFYWGAPAIVAAILLRPAHVFRPMLEGRQRGYFLDMALLMQSVALTAIGLVFAAIGFRLPGQLWATTLGLVVFSWASASLAGATSRRFWSAPPAPVPRNEIWSLQWPLLIAGIGTQVNALSDNLLAGAALGVGQVATLLLTQRLFQLCRVVAGSVSSQGTWTGLVDLRARVGASAFSDRLAEVSKLNLGANLLILAPVLACNRRFVAVWVGETLYAGDMVTIATYVQLSIFTYLCLFTSIIDCMGHTRKRVWVSTIGTALKIAFLIPLIRWLGLAGLPLASALASLSTDAWFGPAVLIWEYGVSARGIILGTMRALLIGGGWAVACYLVGLRTDFVPTGYIGIFVEASALETMGLLIGWFCLLSDTERAGWRERLGRWARAVLARFAFGGGA
jgi:O-antigen/teichoic acid export membrane protein